MSFYQGYVIAHPTKSLVIFVDDYYYFAPNSIGQQLSSASKFGGSSNYISIYKLADIQ